MNYTAKVNLTKKDDSKVKAYVSLIIENCFVVEGLRVIDGQKGLFVSMPNRKIKDNKYKDICYPITAQERQNIIDVVIEAYHEKAGDEIPE